LLRLEGLPVPRSLSILCAWVMLSASSGTALARAGVTLPYSCEMRSGRPVLKASAAKTYPILGARQQQSFATCSRNDPNRCTSMMLHRFEVVCGADRIPWTTLAAALVRARGGQAVVKNGRLHLRRTLSGGAPENDCSGSASFRSGSLRDQPEHWLASGCVSSAQSDRTAILVLPAGFAPVAEIGAAVVPGAADPPLSPGQNTPAIVQPSGEATQVG